jgi:hypothetical protein
MTMKKDKITKKLIELENQYNNIEEQGYSLQDKGQMIVKDSIKGKKSCNYLIDNLPNFILLSEKHPEMKNFLVELELKTEYELNESRQIGKMLADTTKHLNFLVCSTSSTSVSTSTDTMIGISSFNILKSKDPEISIKKPDFIDTEEFEKELDFELDKIDLSLSKRRRGAWETLYSSSQDKIPQAAHSIRDIFSHIISKYASNADVKKADWWKEDRQAKDGVSLRQRIRILLFGPKETIVNDNEIKVIEMNVNVCFHDDKFLKNIAHGSKKGNIDVVASKMRAMEGALLHILKSKNKYSL